jgi:TolA-binding protein
MKALAERARERADELDSQLREIQQTIAELHQIEREAMERVYAAEA